MKLLEKYSFLLDKKILKNITQKVANTELK